MLNRFFIFLLVICSFSISNAKSLSVDSSVKSLTKDYGLVFIFSPSCVHCQRMAPVVSNIKDKYGFEVFPISSNGSGLGNFKNPIPLNYSIKQEFYRGNAERFPLLVLQELDGQMSSYVVANGEATQQQVEYILGMYSQRIALSTAERSKLSRENKDD